ncbi:MAG: hypothetical protein CSB24_03875 [Deltaproteobacteria bacterium]|nr:MAG: hypothetical protein CSB24_03875 [Deltaproteobacteria bacterium]
MKKSSRLKAQNSKGIWFYISWAGLFCLVGAVVYFWPQLSVFFSFNEDDILASRGTIYDRNYKELAVSRERVSVHALTRRIENVEQTALKLSIVLDRDVKEILELLNSSSGLVCIQSSIDQVDEENLQQLNLPGIIMKPGKEKVRFYPENTSAAHILGFSEHGVGLAGVEYNYDRLRYQGRMPAESLTEIDRDGRNLVLTIDLKIQKIIEEFIHKISLLQSDVEIAACMMAGRTGAIIGAANYPFFNPNFFREYDGVPDNILLEPMAVPQNLRFMLRDAAQIKNESGNAAALPWSISYPVIDFGAEMKMWSLLGFDEQPKYDFSLNDYEKKALELAVPLRNARTGVGFVPIHASPIQMLSAFTAMVNGGIKVTPFVCDKVVDDKGKKSFSVEHEKAGQVFGKQVSVEITRSIMAKVRRNRFGGRYIFGTSLQYDNQGGGRNYTKNQIIIAPVPFYDPEVVFMMVIRDHRARPYEKNSNLVDKLDFEEPVSDLLSSLVPLQRSMKDAAGLMQAEETREENFPNIKRTVIKKTALQVKVQPTMPDLLGVSLRKSLRMLSGKGVKVKIEGTGVVVEQNPPPKTVLKKGDVCRVRLEPKKQVI